MTQSIITPITYQRTANLALSMEYMGSIMSFLATSDNTGGRFALMEFQTQPGNEPPPHLHEWEHELFYILEGSVDVYSEGKILTIGPGEIAFLPHARFTAGAFWLTSRSASNPTFTGVPLRSRRCRRRAGQNSAACGHTSSDEFRT